MVTSYKSQVTVDWGSKAAAKKEKSESEHPTVIPVRLFGVVEPLTGIKIQFFVHAHQSLMNYLY